RRRTTPAGVRIRSSRSSWGSRCQRCRVRDCITTSYACTKPLFEPIRRPSPRAGSGGGRARKILSNEAPAPAHLKRGKATLIEPPEREELCNVLEAVLFVADAPI